MHAASARVPSEDRSITKNSITKSTRNNTYVTTDKEISGRRASNAYKLYEKLEFDRENTCRDATHTIKTLHAPRKEASRELPGRSRPKTSYTIKLPKMYDDHVVLSPKRNQKRLRDVKRYSLEDNLRKVEDKYKLVKNISSFVRPQTVSKTKKKDLTPKEHRQQRVKPGAKSFVCEPDLFPARRKITVMPAMVDIRKSSDIFNGGFQNSGKRRYIRSIPLGCFEVVLLVHVFYL